MEKFKLSISDVFGKAFSLFKKHFVITIGVTLSYAMLSLILSAIQGLPYMNMPMTIVSTFVSLLYSIGFTYLLFDALDEKELEMSVFKRALSKLLPYLGCSVLTALAVFLLLLPLFIVVAIVYVTSDITSTTDLLGLGYLYPLVLIFSLPVLWITVRLGFAPYVLLEDPENKITASLRSSWAMTKGYVWPLIGLYLLMILCICLGFVALIVGAFVALVVNSFAQIIVYRSLKNRTNI